MRRIALASIATTYQHTAEEMTVMAQNKENAEAKMAVGDALDDTSRALVHTMGYRGFKHSGPKALAAYRRAKACAGIGHTRRTQHAAVTARLAGASASTPDFY